MVILPQTDFDPSEVALPWRLWTDIGLAVGFATETGGPAACDPVTLDGTGLPLIARALRASEAARVAYAAMIASPAFRQPLRWDEAQSNDAAALLFPGGHAPGMKPYLESPVVAGLAQAAFAAGTPVAAICHGVLALARAGVLARRRTTALTGPMEDLAVVLTRRALPGHYRTYPESVEAEVRRLIGPNGRFERGPLLPRHAGVRAPEAGFVVSDGSYLSARWPGDAWTLALRLAERLG